MQMLRNTSLLVREVTWYTSLGLTLSLRDLEGEDRRGELAGVVSHREVMYGKALPRGEKRIAEGFPV